MKPSFPIDVPDSLWQAVAGEISPEFADSYLFGAELNGTMLEPRTVTGYLKMSERSDFMGLLSRMKITLKGPPLWRKGCDKRASDEVFKSEFYAGRKGPRRQRPDEW